MSGCTGPFGTPRSSTAWPRTPKPYVPARVEEHAVADLEHPVELVLPHGGQAFERAVVPDPLDGALDHDVQACPVRIGSSGENATRVRFDVLGLLFVGAGAGVSLPSNHIAGSGATCGRPSRRTVDNQNISDEPNTATTSAHGTAVASGWLNSSTSWAVGSLLSICSLLACAGTGAPRPAGSDRTHRSAARRVAADNSRHGPQPGWVSITLVWCQPVAGASAPFCRTSRVSDPHHHFAACRRRGLRDRRVS